MKAEIKEILDYMEEGEEILRLREQIKQVDSCDANALQSTVESLHALVSQADAENQKYLGYYHLFLGCAHHEQEDYREAAVHLKQALPKLKGSKNNKAVAHWLLSMNYSSSKEFDKARRELIKAEKLSKARISVMEERVAAKIRGMFNDPIFGEVLPDPQRKTGKVE